jgi:predicted MPP superfamily phosphohydrolase
LNADTLAAASGGAIAAALGAYSLLYEQFSIQVREIELAFPNLPPAFDGYTLLHLSDLHLTKLGLLEKRTMEMVSRREVDGCVITGDVTANPRASDVFRRVCSAIPHRDPILLVLGNSEHKPWLDVDMLIDALTFDGLKMLINSSTTIQRGAESIAVVGLDDPYSRLHDLDAAFRGVDPSGFILCLTHSPSVTPEAIASGADLVLAGHTHGGQVRIPGVSVLWTHMRSNKSLNDGLYTPADLARRTGIDPGHSVLFVNRGVGTSRLHLRLLCPPEIVYITLRRRSSIVNSKSFPPACR